MFGEFYEKVARRLTSWENHRTHNEFENSLITKRFVFEFLDAYMPLFYIAFYQRNINNLRMELTSLYMSDEVSLDQIFSESYCNISDFTI